MSNTEELPFLLIEFDNSAAVDPADIRYRCLIFSRAALNDKIAVPIPIVSSKQALETFGDSTLTSMAKSWLDKAPNIPLYCLPYNNAGISIEDWKSKISVLKSEKSFDIIIISTNVRQYISEFSKFLEDLEKPEVGKRSLLITAFQSSFEAAALYTSGGDSTIPNAPALEAEPIVIEKVEPEVKGRIRKQASDESTKNIDQDPALLAFAVEDPPSDKLREAEINRAAAAPTFPINFANVSILVSPVVTTPNHIIAVNYAAEIAVSGEKSPARPFNGLKLRDVTPPLVEDFTRDQKNKLVKSGLSVYSIDFNGDAVIERAVTTRTADSRGEPDYSMADVNVPLIDIFLQKSFSNYFWVNYISQRAVLVDDSAVVPANVDFPVIKPRTAKAEALNVYRIWQEKLVVQDEETFLDSLKVERDGKTLKFSFKARYIQALLGIEAKIYRAR